MRRATRVDNNQAVIVQALNSIGCTVQHLHSVGQGCPDLLVGYRGFNYLLEVKDGKKPPSERKLKPDQIEWHQLWKGQVAVVTNINEAIAVVREAR